MSLFRNKLVWSCLLLGSWLALAPGRMSTKAVLIPSLAVCKVQGSGFTSPYADRMVQTGGVVIADLDTTLQRGFFIQEPGCDEDPRTSDGVFVFLGIQEDIVQVGDWVEVTGLVQENFGQTEVLTSSEDVTILSTGNPLPAPEALGPPWDSQEARYYFEGREGMRVGVAQGVVVGPTNLFGETWLVRADLGVERVFQDDPAGTGVIITLSREGLYELDPPAAVGDRVEGVVGVMRYSEGVYQLLLTVPPTRSTGWIGRMRADNNQPVDDNISQAHFSFSVGTLNLHNLFDTVDDPTRDDPIRSASAYQRHLEKLALTIQNELGAPLLLGVQEVENQGVLTDLANRPEFRVDYESVWLEGPDRRGIDVGLLYQPARVRILSFALRQGCTALEDGLGPDGNHEVDAPENQLTCDRDGDGILDGNRLFSRPPLEVVVRVCVVTCQYVPGQPYEFIDLVLIINHWKSKSQDTPFQSYTFPRRMAQAVFVAELVSQRLSESNFHLVVLGDLNDYPTSGPLNTILAARLESLWTRVEHPKRYSYIYRGVSQVLDYLLVSPALVVEWIQVTVGHTNADFPYVFQDVAGSPYRASDHDGVVAEFTLLQEKIYLPIGSRGPN